MRYMYTLYIYVYVCVCIVHSTNINPINTKIIRKGLFEKAKKGKSTATCNHFPR